MSKEKQPAKLARLAGWLTTRTLFRWLPVEIHGAEHLPDKPFILASNHISFIDSVILCAFIIPKRRIVPLVWHTYFRFPLSVFMKSVNAIPISDDGLSLKKLKHIISALKTTSILIFPEGQRTNTQDLNKIKGGLGLIAKMSKAPVIPVTLLGTEKVMPIGAKCLKRHKIQIIVNKAMYYDSSQSYDDFSKCVMKRIFEHSL